MEEASYFKITKKHSFWLDTSEKKWNDWRWQQQNRINSIDKLKKIIPLSPKEITGFEKTQQIFNVGISPYYISLIDPKNEKCPIRMQSIPISDELFISPYDIDDPLNEEGNMPVPGITHRYPDRVLLYTIHNCAVYCRFCTRKRKVSFPSSTSSKHILEHAFQYIEKNKEIRDVVISGGDPLSYSDHHLELILKRIRSIKHIQIFRIGTRNLVTLPQRITPQLASMLAKYHPVYIHTHFNHPKECTLEAFNACKLLANAGCVLNNQTVLLKGINDDPKIIKELNQKLLMMRVQPYILYQCDAAKGLSHFRTPIQKGIEIIDNLRGWTSGMAVPHFIVDLPGGGGKVSLIPNYVVKQQGKNWKFRNYKNEIFEYVEP